MSEDASRRGPESDDVLGTTAAVESRWMSTWDRVIAEDSDPLRVARARIARAHGSDLPRMTEESLLLDGLRVLWESDELSLALGLRRLAGLYRRQARHAEALALGRRLLEWTVRHGHPRAMWHACVALAATFVELDELRRAEDHLARAAALPSPDELEVEPRMLRLRETLVAECELARGDHAPAERLLAHWRADGSYGRDHRSVALAIRVNERRGNLRSALEVAETDLIRHDSGSIRGALAGCDVARLRLMMRRDMPAVGNAVRVLEHVVSAPNVSLGPGRRATLAIELAELLARIPSGRGALRRATDLAGACALERVAQAAEFFRDPPGPLDLPPDLEATIQRRRRAIALRYEDLLGAAAGILADDPARLPAPDARDDDTLVQACAWCRRLATPDGRWVRVVDFRPPPGALALTHGICDSCVAIMQARDSNG